MVKFEYIDHHISISNISSTCKLCHDEKSALFHANDNVVQYVVCIYM